MALRIGVTKVEEGDIWERQMGIFVSYRIDTPGQGDVIRNIVVRKYGEYILQELENEANFKFDHSTGELLSSWYIETPSEDRLKIVNTSPQAGWLYRGTDERIAGSRTPGARILGHEIGPDFPKRIGGFYWHKFGDNFFVRTYRTAGIDKNSIGSQGYSFQDDVRDAIHKGMELAREDLGGVEE